MEIKRTKRTGDCKQSKCERLIPALLTMLLMTFSMPTMAQYKREALKYAGFFKQNELVRFTNGKNEAYAIFFHISTGMYFKDKEEMINTLETLYKTKIKVYNY